MFAFILLTENNSWLVKKLFSHFIKWCAGRALCTMGKKYKKAAANYHKSN